MKKVHYIPGKTPKQREMFLRRLAQEQAKTVEEPPCPVEMQICIGAHVHVCIYDDMPTLRRLAYLHYRSWILSDADARNHLHRAVGLKPALRLAPAPTTAWQCVQSRDGSVQVAYKKIS